VTKADPAARARQAAGREFIRDALRDPEATVRE
jgi:hypothetical protein